MISEGPSVVHLASFQNGYPFKPDDLGDEGEPVIRIRQLLDESAEPERAVPPLRAVFIDDGDLVFSWSATLAVRTWRRGRALLNQHLFKVEPRPGVDPGWLRYVLEAGIDRLKPLMHGSAMTHITGDMLRMLKVRLPTLDEQRAIARYLDAEVARIDATVDARARLVGLLRERRRVLVTTLTTQGVTGVDGSRGLMTWPPSELPPGWSLVQLRHLARVGRGASPRPIDDQVYFDPDGKYGWVRIADVTASGRYLEVTEDRLSEIGASKSVKLEPGALILSIAASVGNPIITRVSCCIHDGFVYFAGLKELEPEYLYYLLLGGAMFGGLGKLGTQLNLNTDTIGGIRVPVPPRGEQAAIIAALDQRLAALDEAVVVAGRQVDLLLERRRALVDAAVLGQLDIPASAA